MPPGAVDKGQCPVSIGVVSKTHAQNMHLSYRKNGQFYQQQHPRCPFETGTFS
jgi:hypothetical protein